MEKEPLDLAVLDVMLPDMNGFALCQKIRENHVFPIIMLTAKVEDMDKIMGLTLGAVSYTHLPFGSHFDDPLDRQGAVVFHLEHQNVLYLVNFLVIRVGRPEKHTASFCHLRLHGRVLHCRHFVSEKARDLSLIHI